MKIRFEEKAFFRQRFLEVNTKTMQTGYMLHEWIKKNEEWLKKLNKH